MQLSVIAGIQLCYAIGAGLLIGDTWPHSIGIFFGLMTLAPIVK